MRILIIDDEEIQRVTLEDELVERGYRVDTAPTAEEALHLTVQTDYDLILTDLRLPGKSGIDLIRELREKQYPARCIVMTAFGAVDTAVEAMKLGAYDYLTKPFSMDELTLRLRHLEELQRITGENRILKQRLRELELPEFIVGRSAAMQTVFGLIQTVAPTDTTVLIQGSTGTGKEVVANTIHALSERKDTPLVKVSCAILSREILESELFGHEKGAFTGAAATKIGRFEKADGGTIYLDDIDDIPLDLQVKLLRVLQEKEIERVGSTEPRPVDVRILASTKVNLKDRVDQGTFRSDLFYRLNIFPITIPDLKDRKEDIPVLVKHFLDEFYPGQDIHLEKEALDCFLAYPWDGNVRELKNLVERLSVVCGCNPIRKDCLPPEFFRQPERSLRSEGLEALPFHAAVTRFEKELIQQTLDQCGGNRSEAARTLGLPVSTLKSKLKKLGL
ncbi:MAG: sigma-54-dependent Fis family transcriptional regulator [Candidatus Neomarinimicrobiota bacterium]|nr:MAG: sigma-54-dependent Fis family transcriptional regulator [Candidatus Neomarinimicrobiota bacterium]